jgi:hypothetical protein
MLLAAHQSISSMVDEGANICLTNILSLLVDVVDIPLLPISVAVVGSNVKTDQCCTKAVISLENIQIRRYACVCVCVCVFLSSGYEGGYC